MVAAMPVREACRRSEPWKPWMQALVCLATWKAFSPKTFWTRAQRGSVPRSAIGPSCQRKPMALNSRRTASPYWQVRVASLTAPRPSGYGQGVTTVGALRVCTPVVALVDMPKPWTGSAVMTTGMPSGSALGHGLDVVEVGGDAARPVKLPSRMRAWRRWS